MERWGRVKSGGGGGALSHLQESPRCPTHPMGKWEAGSNGTAAAARRDGERGV